MPGKIKGYLGSEQGHDIAFVSIAILVGAISFFLGRISVLEGQTSSVLVSLPASSTLAAPIAASSYTGDFTLKEAKAAVSTSGAFLASKNGTKYYPNGCSAANRIKPENRVWFQSEEEAQSAGFSRTTSCK